MNTTLLKEKLKLAAVQGGGSKLLRCQGDVAGCLISVGICLVFLTFLASESSLGFIDSVPLSFYFLLKKYIYTNFNYY